MSLVPARHNFKIYEGATFYKRITYKVSGAVVDLTEYKEAWLIVKDEQKGTILLELPTLSMGGVGGTIDILIPASTTSSLLWEQGVYELFVKDPLERVDVILHGSFKVVPF